MATINTNSAPDPMAGIPDATAWAATIPDAEVWSASVAQPWDDTPDFTEDADPEVDTVIRLDGDRRHVTTPTRRLFVDYRSNPDAFRHLDPLPAEGESLHGVISGKYALADLLPAIIEHAGDIETLHVATLSFNKQNAADILGMLDAGQIRSMKMLISYYYKSTSREIYDMLVPQLRERGHQVLACRNHAKILLAKMVSGAMYTVESSANLRSSVNIEQFVMTRDAGLYEFQRTWIDDLLNNGQELGEKDTNGRKP